MHDILNEGEKVTPYKEIKTIDPTEHKVVIVSDGKETRVYENGKEIKLVKSINFSGDCDTAPTLTIERDIR